MLKFGIRLMRDMAESANLVTAAVVIFNFCKQQADPEFEGPEIVEHHELEDENEHIINMNGMDGKYWTLYM